MRPDCESRPWSSARIGTVRDHWGPLPCRARLLGQSCGYWRAACSSGAAQLLGGGCVPAPLGLFCSAWGLPFGGEDIHPNPSKTTVGTETQLHWLIGRTVMKKMHRAVRRETLLSNFVLTRRAVLRTAVTQQRLASWSWKVQKSKLESLSHTLAPRSWFCIEFAGA